VKTLKIGQMMASALLGLTLLASTLSLTLGLAPTTAYAAPPCFPDFHELPASSFQACFDYWTQQGRWPVALTADQHNGATYLAGSFQPGASRPVRHLISAQTYEQDFATFRDQGFRPARVNILNTASGLRFTAIWTPIDGEFYSGWNMSPEVFDARWHDLYSQGFLETDIFAYQDNGLKFAATWVKKPFTNYATYYGMTADQYQSRFDQLSSQGLAVTDFVAYQTPLGLRYAAIWESLPGDWAHYFGLSAAAYQQKYDAMSAQGYRLTQIDAYGNGLYAAAWHRP
jgi:hypothetical protein